MVAGIISRNRTNKLRRGMMTKRFPTCGRVLNKICGKRVVGQIEGFRGSNPKAYVRNTFGCRRQIGNATDQPKVGS
jgi:hypothetical protein